jgi:hypothetical protein
MMTWPEIVKSIGLRGHSAWCRTFYVGLRRRSLTLKSRSPAARFKTRRPKKPQSPKSKFKSVTPKKSFFLFSTSDLPRAINKIAGQQ